MTEFTTQDYEEFFTYLDQVRESGITNMFGATPLLEDMFGTNRADSKKILLHWMETFSEDKEPWDRATEITAKYG